MDSKTYDFLLERIKYYSAYEDSWGVELLDKNKLGRSLFSLATDVRRGAIYEYLVYQNLSSFKNKIYKTNQILTFVKENYSEELDHNNCILNWDIYTFYMSDHGAIKDRFLRNIEYRYLNHHKYSVAIFNAIYGMHLKDEDLTQMGIDMMYKYNEKSSRSWRATPIVLEAIWLRNHDQLQEGLKLAAKLYSRRTDAMFHGWDFDYETLFLCKLATSMGMEIGYDVPNVPSELIPYEPLDHYETYDIIQSKEYFEDYVKKIRQHKSNLPQWIKKWIK